jgi:molybdate transport system regulatory protein
MTESIRNTIEGTIRKIVSDKVMSEVVIETAVGEIAAVVTTQSVKDMKLKRGAKVSAIIKATNVAIRA